MGVLGWLEEEGRSREGDGFRMGCGLWDLEGVVVLEEEEVGCC